MKTYDRIVLGVGGIGSAALYQLAARGTRVLGIEQFSIGHDRGSSHGQTRIIRKAYFEHSSYVPLLNQAYLGWEKLERESGELLFERVGLVEVGPPTGELIPGILASASLHQLPLEKLSAQEFKKKYPAFLLPAGMQAIVEPDAGFLHVERCVHTHVEQAVRQGAELLTETRIVSIGLQGNHVEVVTTAGTYRAAGVIVCGGAWSTGLLGTLDLKLPVEVTRKHLHWFDVRGKFAAKAGLPAFFYELPEGCFYGFPALDGCYMKVAQHSHGGEVVETPGALNQDVDLNEQARVTRNLRQIFADPPIRPVQHAACMYTSTPDGHFIVDRHPQHEAIVFAAGFSGHGFKFAPALGSILADLSLAGKTSLPIDFLRWGRFGAIR